MRSQEKRGGRRCKVVTVLIQEGNSVTIIGSKGKMTVDLEKMLCSEPVFCFLIF